MSYVGSIALEAMNVADVVGTGDFETGATTLPDDDGASLSPCDGSPANFMPTIAANWRTMSVSSNGTLGGLVCGKSPPPVAMELPLECETSFDKPDFKLCTRPFKASAVRSCVREKKNERNVCEKEKKTNEMCVRKRKKNNGKLTQFGIGEALYALAMSSQFRRRPYGVNLFVVMLSTSLLITNSSNKSVSGTLKKLRLFFLLSFSCDSSFNCRVFAIFAFTFDFFFVDIVARNEHTPNGRKQNFEMTEQIKKTRSAVGHLTPKNVLNTVKLTLRRVQIEFSTYVFLYFKLVQTLGFNLFQTEKKSE